MQLKDK